jgi:hypothetical protein
MNEVWEATRPDPSPRHSRHRGFRHPGMLLDNGKKIKLQKKLYNN